MPIDYKNYYLLNKKKYYSKTKGGSSGSSLPLPIPKTQKRNLEQYNKKQGIQEQLQKKKKKKSSKKYQKKIIIIIIQHSRLRHIDKKILNHNYSILVSPAMTFIVIMIMIMIMIMMMKI